MSKNASMISSQESRLFSNFQVPLDEFLPWYFQCCCSGRGVHKSRGSNQLNELIMVLFNSISDQIIAWEDKLER